MGDIISFPLPPDESAAPDVQLTPAQIAEYLRDAEIFSEAHVEQLFRLASLARVVQFPAGQTIFEEDSITDALFVVVGGKVELTSDEHNFREIIGPRKAFSLYSFLVREPNDYGARALANTLALTISTEDFYNLLSQNPELAVSVFKYFARKLNLRPRSRQEARGI
jgi:CRP-like cAMP-binding protein